MRCVLHFFLVLAGLTHGFAAAVLTAQVQPAEASVGDEVLVTYTVANGAIEKLVLPQIDGLQVQPGSNTTTSLSFSNGTLSRSVSQSFRMIAMHSGDLTIPAFDITTTDGEVLHGKALKVHVLAGANPNPTTVQQPAPTPQPIVITVNPGSGPVVMPPNATISPNGATPGEDPYADVPKAADGGPAKVFILITPQTTEAYVGQSIPIRIDFYIRMESNADQNSLPTIKGSNFLMNNFSIRGRAALAVVKGIQYERDTWVSAISAPKPGDFPLAMERDTYWVKSSTNPSSVSLDSFAGFFNRHQNLAHEMVSSNQLTIHVQPLPEIGRPEHFTGAIGRFDKISGDAQPTRVAVGEPVRLKFTIGGEGNFDYVRCPNVPDDPAWKEYTATSKTNYLDESHTHAEKTFEQSLIPQKNGTLPIETATFSYFDPVGKQYVTVPIPLPAITVTGSPIAAAPAVQENADAGEVLAKTPVDFLPNRVEIGATHFSLLPLYRHGWFWGVQAGLLLMAILAAIFVWVRPRPTDDGGKAERARQRHSVLLEEDAMAQAVQRNDALAFFLAARHAVQLKLGAQWHVTPEALTLGEIRRRDEHLAETLEPLFVQTDDVVYSGRASSPVDLAQWERNVREILKPEVAVS